MSQEKKSLAAIVSTAIEARNNCYFSGNATWLERWQAVVDNAAFELPRGSGFDSYPEFDLERTKANKIVITGSYHAMDEYGSYDGWRDYTVFVYPEFSGIRVTVKGGGEHAGYIGDCFHDALSAAFDPDSFRDDIKADNEESAS